MSQIKQVADRGGSSSPLTASARSVFEHLRRHGPFTRPQLCDALGFSKPTMSQAIAELEGYGYVSHVGRMQGEMGRSAQIYGLGPEAGHVLAIDAGSTQVRLAACKLDGTILHEIDVALSASQRRLNAEIASVVDRETGALTTSMRPEWGPLRAIGVAVPARVHPDPENQRQDERLHHIFDSLTRYGDVPIMMENNVNCAAVAEHSLGVGRGSATCIYLQIGIKIGMGLVLDNHLVRGRTGAAGEISEIPFPWSPGGKLPEREALENYMSVEALLNRVAADWTCDDEGVPHTPAELFSALRSGNHVAANHIRRHAEDIARIALTCMSTIDPDCLVLGGGVGGAPEILPYVRTAVRQMGATTEVLGSSLGAEATLLGISTLTADQGAIRMMAPHG